MKRWQWLALAALAAAASAVQVLGPHPEHAHWWDLVPGAYAGFGFAGCALIVVASKWLGKALLLRKEGYYRDL